MGSWHWLLFLWVSASIPCIKILRTIFIAANLETVSDEMSSFGSVCVDRISITNRLPFLLMCVSHIWLEVTNLHCLNKLTTGLLILYGNSEWPHLFGGYFTQTENGKGILCEYTTSTVPLNTKQAPR